MSYRSSKIALSVAALTVLPLALTACSSDSTSETPVQTNPPSSSAPAPSASTDASIMPMPSESLVGGDPSTWSPVQLTPDMNGQEVTLVPGQVAIISGLPADDETNNIVVTTDNPAVIQVMQGDGTTTNSGFMALTPGDAVVVVEDGFAADEGTAVPVLQFTVRVVAGTEDQTTSDMPMEDGMEGGSEMPMESPEVTH